MYLLRIWLAWTVSAALPRATRIFAVMNHPVKIALIREGKIPEDNRVAFTPRQCAWIQQHYPRVRLTVQPSPSRCYRDGEYRQAGISLQEDITDCDILIGIKEVPAEQLVPGKTYLFFSHTRKQQPQNRALMQALLAKKITLIDYECLVHDDGHRILGFGFFAGVVGAHNGLLAYGKKTGAYVLQPARQCHDLRALSETYFGMKLPPLKIVLTGSGRVAAGALEVMGMLGIKDVPPEEFLISDYNYPVYTQLKGEKLYRRTDGLYSREDFHRHPDRYTCHFLPFTTAADILVNGIYWEGRMAPLFTWEDMQQTGFRIKVIADVTNDREGSVPCNLGDAMLADPVYGVDRFTRQKTAPFLPGTVDMMCVGNLPNELPRDASRYFGEQLIKYVFDDLLQGEGKMIRQGTLVKAGRLTPAFRYLSAYAGLS
ncbi:NAD(P)-dependent oxidoreductase [Compostibacter hankyongensis]|uniref:NAD(P)-dependent oxidoreductase n=1 Tax=Compostibacter hankyongensis TaxID=1007089 RepID=UPI0031EA1468